MSATPSKLLAGFVGFILSVYLFSGVSKAEQIAETESRDVLEVGTRGILPCRLQRKAHLVQWTWWTRELTSEHLLVYLDPYSSIRRRGGPGYTEGLFNITEDYSLVIKDVKVRDEGLFVCEVSEFQTGKLFRNRTIVSVRGTGASVVLEIGARVILPCRIQRGAYQVKWKRQLSSVSDMSETELLVSFDQFFNIGERDGPGYKAGLFNITDDYSLVIKDVKVQDEGLYICTLFDIKTDKVFRNSTRVFVQAFPEESFPIIQECVGKDVNPGVCTVIVHATSNLTCFVVGYYPNIDLFFLHGSEKVRSTGYEEWNNEDGTKNLKIRVQVGISKEPYKCVASSLPGIVGNRSLSVIVHGKNSPPTHSQGPIVAAIVVPVLIIVGICLTIAVIVKCRVCRSTRRGFYRIVPGAAPVRVPEGPVSKLELWTLVTKAKEKRDFKKLRKALSRLGHLSKADALKLQNDDDFYECLCEWKSKTSSDPNQRKKLYSACSQVGMFGITGTLEVLVRNTSYQVSQADIDHILWEIGDTSTISELLRALKLTHEEVIMGSEEGIREVIDVARGKLMMWQKRNFDINPLVILSLKLDDLQCKTNFFKINESLKEEIDDRMMKAMCFRVFGDHCMYLVKAIREYQGEGLPHKLVGKVVEENNESLFNALQMLHDWVRDEECSNHEKISKLLKAAEAARQTHHTDAKWPLDDDLRVIASFLSPTSMEQLCSELDIKSPPQTASQEERFQALTEWRNNYASSKDLKEKHTELFNALREIKRGDLIPHFKGQRLVYKTELVDLAFHLFAQDLLPFTEALGISAAKLVDYRPTFQPSHMTKGTIGLVCKLFESRQRADYINLLKEVPYANVLASAMLALEVSFEEVCAVAVSPVNCQKEEIKRKPVKRSQSFSHGDNRHDINIENNFSSSCSDKLISSGSNQMIYEDITSNVDKGATTGLTPMLTAASMVEDPNQVSLESSTFIKHFKLWRKQPRMTPYNFRLAVANRLRIKAIPHLISDFLRGDCTKGEIPFTFIFDIIQTMNSNQIRILNKLLGLAPFTPLKVRSSMFYSQEEELPRPEEISHNVHTWAKEWILHIKQSEWKKGEDGFLTSEVAKEHKEFNDKLVHHGFIDLAREIMIGEQQLIYAHHSSGFASKE